MNASRRADGGGASNLRGGAVLESDPGVTEAGVDTGFSPEPGTLRAPDVAVGNVPEQPGWVRGVPPLAVEYADTGQDEDELQKKITELLDAGTRWIWVVRLCGPRRVEVFESGKPVRVHHPGDELSAPGVLRNPVPVTALFDREAAHEATLRNLLQRRGYDSIEDVRAQGAREALLALVEARGLTMKDEDRARIAVCKDIETLKRWIARAATAVELRLR